MKDNFLLRKNLKEVVEELPDDDAGKLFKGILRYVNVEDSKLDGYLKIIFIPIRTDIDKNEEKYEKRCEMNKTNGSRGGAPKGNENAKKGKTTENNRMVEKTTENNQKQPKTTENNMNSHNHNHNHISLSLSNNINHNKLLNNKLNDIKEIVDYLNIKTNSKYKYSSKITQTKINARLNEGYKLDDFIAVIDKKYDEWVGTEFEKYLCPETLFGTKFEKYLNQKEMKKEKVQPKNNTNEDSKEWI